MLFKKIFSFLIVVFFISTNCIQTDAVGAYPYPIQITQKDGSTLTIQLQGDENFHYTTTEDGYLIRQNSSGLYTYAESKLNGEIIPGKILARDKQTRTSAETKYLNEAGLVKPLNYNLNSQIFKAPTVQPGAASTGYPKKGSPKSLVILVNFKDTVFKVSSPLNSFNRLLNEVGYNVDGATGSSRDYFMSASNGKFSPQFDVVGPVTLPGTMAYYGKNMKNGNDTLAVQMVVDACTAANASVDFTKYDTNSDGYIDNVFIYYAGHNEAEGGPESSIWPHRWAVQKGSNYFGTPNSIVFDNKKLFDYACTSELKGKSGTTNMCGIGTFTHEFGHVIGLADYYHTSTSSKVTLSTWDIMALGVYLNSGKTPPTYSAFDRFYLGWITPTELTQPGKYALNPLSQLSSAVQDSTRQVYLFSETKHNLSGSNPSPKEYYLAEYRKKLKWDAYLPAEGMLFWHIDYNDSVWSANAPNNYTGSTQTAASHMRVYLQPLTGYESTPGTAFTTGDFDPQTWTGKNINRKVSDIAVGFNAAKMRDSISFNFMGGPIPNPQLNVGLVRNNIHFGSISPGDSIVKNIRLKGYDLTQYVRVQINGINADQFSTGSYDINTAVINSNAGAIIRIVYKPTQTGDHVCTLQMTGLNVQEAITLTGSCVAKE